MNHLFQKAYREIEKAENIFLVTHFNPDGDAISSICAMIEYLSQKGKNYLAFCHSPLPENYNFVPHAGEIKCSADLDLKNSRSLDSFDLVMVFDCANQERTALASILSKHPLSQKVIEFDHHPNTDAYADIELRDPGASSTTEIVYSFFKANNISVNKKMATCILTGIITDTDAFLYPSASRRTVKISSEMLSAGACHSRIVEKFLRNKSLGALKTWGSVLAGLAINKKYNLAVAALTHKEFRERNISEEEYEGLSGFLSNLTGVNAVLFLRENEEGMLRGSLRTAIKPLDISRLAGVLGGGGHKNASGFTLAGRLVPTDSGWKVE